jgi:branched-subunit amino acid ABC-type transport system permease component
MGIAIRTLASGLSIAAVLFLVAAGLNLIWGVLRIMNFATGSVYMLGAYGAVTILADVSSGNLGFLLALVLVPLAMCAIGMVIEVLLLRRTYARDDEDQQFMLTLALSYIVTGLVVEVFGTQFKLANPPPFLSGTVHLLGVVIPVYTLFTIAAGLLIAVGVWALLHRTRLGLLTRAAVNDRGMLAVLGVNVARIYTLIFGIGVGLGAVGGVLIAPVSAVTSHLDLDLLVPAFVVCVAGGLGRVGGALIAALLIGLLQAFLALEASSLAPLSPYIVMTVALVVRPLGAWIVRLRGQRVTTA